MSIISSIKWMWMIFAVLLYNTVYIIIKIRSFSSQPNYVTYLLEQILFPKHNWGSSLGLWIELENEKVIGGTNVMLRGDVDTWLQWEEARKLFLGMKVDQKTYFLEHAHGLNVTVLSNGLSEWHKCLCLAGVEIE